jgi:hypothetical protein
MYDYMNEAYEEMQKALHELVIEEANWAFMEAFSEQN